MWFSYKVSLGPSAVQINLNTMPGHRYDINPELSIWLYQNCKKWSHKPIYKGRYGTEITSVDFIFSKKSDAVHFKLVHHGIHN